MAPEDTKPSSLESDEQFRLDELKAVEPGSADGLAAVLGALGDPSWRVRKEAVNLAGRWPDIPGVVGGLVETVKEAADAVARNAAVEALVLVGSEAVGFLAKTFESGHPRRKLFIDALGGIGDASASATLISALEDGDENTRMAAAEALGEVGGSRAAESLCARLGREGVLVTAAVMEALWKLGEPVPVDRVLPLVADNQLRRLAVRLLGLSGATEALDPVLAALIDETPPTREPALQAAEVLHELAAPETKVRLEERVTALGSNRIDALAGALASQNPAVRCAAATVLSWTRNADVIEPLCRALADEQSGDAAADALCAMSEVAAGRLGPIAERLDGPGRKALYGLILRLGSLPPSSAAALEASLVADLGRPDEDLAQAAAAALEVVGGSGAVRPLADFLATPGQDEALVHTAASALGGLGLRHRDTVTAAVVSLGDSLPPMALGPLVSRMGGAEFLPLVRAALENKDVDARVSAVRALSGLSGLPDARSLVESALADFDPQVRAAAALLLGNLADSRAQAAVPKALKDTDAQVRSAAARAAGRMGSTKSSPMLQALVMTDDSPAVAVEALEALRALGTEIPADVLKAALAHSDSEVVKAALRCAADLQGQAVDLDTVEAALGHQSWDVRLEAVRTLSRCAESERVRRALSALLKIETDGLVRQVAQENLERVRGGRRS